MKSAVIWCEHIVVCPWTVKFVIVYPSGYLEEHLAQSLLYNLCDFCRMGTWHLQESTCHVVLAVNSKMLGFHLTNLRCANKYVYAARSQEICIVNDLGTISVFLKFSAWKESSVLMRLRGCSQTYVEHKRILWLLRSAVVLHRCGCSATGVSVQVKLLSWEATSDQPLSTHIAFTWKQGRSLGAAFPKEARRVGNYKRYPCLLRHTSILLLKARWMWALWWNMGMVSSLQFQLDGLPQWALASDLGYIHDGAIW